MDRLVIVQRQPVTGSFQRPFRQGRFGCIEMRQPLGHGETVDIDPERTVFDVGAAFQPVQPGGKRLHIEAT